MGKSETIETSELEVDGLILALTCFIESARFTPAIIKATLVKLDGGETKLCVMLRDDGTWTINRAVVAPSLFKDKVVISIPAIENVTTLQQLFDLDLTKINSRPIRHAMFIQLYSLFDLEWNADLHDAMETRAKLPDEFLDETDPGYDFIQALFDDLSDNEKS